MIETVKFEDNAESITDISNLDIDSIVAVDYSGRQPLKNRIRTLEGEMKTQRLDYQRRTG